MPRGGARVGAGRPKKGEQRAPKVERSAAVEPGPPVIQQSAQAGTVARTPLDYMLSVMNDPTADLGRRDRLAVAAAPYLHGKAVDSGKKQERQKANATSRGNV